jgi:hypothetical protein
VFPQFGLNLARGATDTTHNVRWTIRAVVAPRFVETQSDGGTVMTSKRLWLAGIAAALGFSAAGCQTNMGGMTLPSPRYLEHQPQYFTSDPVFPLPRELATQIDPTGAGGLIGGPGGPAVVPPAVPVPVPVGPVMPLGKMP